MAFESDRVFQGTGAKIKRTIKTTDADQFGFTPEDVIIEVNGASVWSPQRFLGIIGTYPAESPLKVKVIRSGSQKPVVLSFNLPANPPGQLFFTIAEPEERDQYLRVSKVEKGSPAEIAGLKHGDELINIQGEEMTMSPSYQYLFIQDWIVNLGRNTKIYLRVRRKNENGIDQEVIITYIAR